MVVYTLPPSSGSLGFCVQTQRAPLTAELRSVLPLQPGLLVARLTNVNGPAEPGAWRQLSRMKPAVTFLLEGHKAKDI